MVEVALPIKGLGFHASSISRYTVIESYAAGRCHDPHTNKSLREFPNMASAGTANGRPGAARGGGRAASSCENLKNYEHRIHFYDRFGDASRSPLAARARRGDKLSAIHDRA